MDPIPNNQPITSEDNIVTQVPVKQELKQNNKLLMVIPIAVLLLIILALIFIFIFKRQDGFFISFFNSLGVGSTEITPTIKEEMTPEATPSIDENLNSNSKYTQEYFDQAKRENRELNDEEQLAYFKLNLKVNTIFWALLNNKEVKCTSGQEDDEIAFVTDMYIKNGNLRVENYSTATKDNKISSIITANDFWGWIIPNENDSNYYQAIVNESERFQLIGYAVMENGESEEYYKKSCTESSIDDKFFEKPEGIVFNER